MFWIHFIKSAVDGAGSCRRRANNRRHHAADESCRLVPHSSSASDGILVFTKSQSNLALSRNAADPPGDRVRLWVQWLMTWIGIVARGGAGFEIITQPFQEVRLCNGISNEVELRDGIEDYEVRQFWSIVNNGQIFRCIFKSDKMQLVPEYFRKSGSN